MDNRLTEASPGTTGPLALQSRPMRRVFLTALTVFCARIAAGQSQSLAPFVATPPDVVDRMLTMARTGPDDVVYDLGCGDGRIVIAAALKFRAHGVSGWTSTRP